MKPIVRYFLVCDDVIGEEAEAECVHIECLRSTIVSAQEPAYPLIHPELCIFLVVTECRGSGVGGVRVMLDDAGRKELMFGSTEHVLDFSTRSPLELLGFTFRLKSCHFPRAGRYTVEFWYNRKCIAELPLELR